MNDSSKDKRTVFLTGATGNIGRKLAARILEESADTRLLLLVRATSEAEGLRRVYSSLSVAEPTLDLRRAHKRIGIILGDLTRPNLGVSSTILGRLRTEVTHVIHSAASTKFHMPVECATQINVEGTRKVLDLALDLYRHGRLEVFGHVSTAFQCGMRDGIVREDELKVSQQFANSYEQSKWLAERLVHRHMAELPTVIFRPSIVVGDSRTGRIVSFNVLYTPIRLIWSGNVDCLPAQPGTTLDIVPVDWVANAIWYIMSNTQGFTGKIYHLTAGEGHCLSVGEIVDRVVARFNMGVSGQRLRQPAFVDCDSLPASTRTDKRAALVHTMLTQFAPYINCAPVFDCTNTSHALEGSGFRMPEISEYLDRVLSYCLSVVLSKVRRQAA